MPQLFSRMDDVNWLTPSIADILDQGAPPPAADSSMREMIVQLQDAFAQQETPVKVVNVRPTPSYTLFMLQPETVGRLGNRRAITPNEIRRSLAQIAEQQKAWRLGFMAQVEDAPDQVGLLVRTDQHRPLSLRRLLLRNTFREHPSSFAFTLGNTLDQQLIVHDLTQTPHIAILGESNARQHLISSLLLTLTLFNTPSELRFLFAGEGTQAYEELAHLPHLLDGTSRITTADALIAALNHLTAEAQSRLERFYEEGINEFDRYNTRMRDHGKQGLPRIIITLDALSDEAFEPALSQITPLLRDLLVNGAQVGIHLIFAVKEAIPRPFNGLIPLQIVMRSSAADLNDKLKNWHNSLLRFVDAFIMEDANITPVELCAISPEEIQNATAYWQNVSQQRQQDEAANTPFNPVAIKQRAAMLAAYLGWLSMGALQDIFGIHETDAQEILHSLQENGIIEANDGAMHRFIRLADLAEHQPQ